jgi:hypothetical protein
LNVDAVEEGIKAVTNSSDLKHLKNVILSNVETTLDSINGKATTVEEGGTRDLSLHDLNDYME